LYPYPHYNYNIIDQLSYCVHNMYLWRVWTRLTRQLFLLFASMNNNNKCSTTTYFWTIIIIYSRYALYSLKIENCRALPLRVEWLLLWIPPAKPNGLKISDSASTRVGSRSEVLVPRLKNIRVELRPCPECVYVRIVRGKNESHKRNTHEYIGTHV